jgi:membrane protein
LIGRRSTNAVKARSTASTRTRPAAARGPRAAGFFSPGTWWSILRDAASGWLSHSLSKEGAALAYYSLFSLGPLMLVAISIAGLVFGEEAVRGQLSVQLAGLLGEQGAKGVESLLAGVGQPQEGFLAGLLGIVTILIAAVTVVVQLKDALNLVWGTEAKPAAGIGGFIRKYAVSLAGVLAIGFLLLVSLLITTVLSAMGNALSGYLHETLLQLVSLAVSLLVTTLLFALMFKYLPDIEVGWRDVLPGALITAILFELGKFLIGLYIGKQGLESTYGAAASLVIVMVWVYYSTQLVLFGAEVTRAYTGRRHKREGK